MKGLRKLYILLFFSIFCFVWNGYSQVPTAKQDSIINNLVEQYKQKLALTGEQEVIFKEKLQTFYLDKEEIRKEMRGEKMLKTLYDLGKQENGEMRDILRGEQFDLYVRIKPSLQPLEELDVQKKS